MNRLSFAPIALIVIGGLALAGCSDDAPEADKPTGALSFVNEGTLTVCSNPPFEPFEMTDDTGKVVGFDMSIMDEVAKDLGVKVEVIQTPFEGIQSGQDLNSGKCDVIASGVTMTDKRKQKLDFSDPYFDVDLGLLVPKGSDLNTLDAIKGKQISVQQANTAEDWAKEKDLDTVQFEDVGLQVQALQTGKVDAALNDIAVMNAFAKQNPELEVSTQFSTGEQYGFGVKKGSTKLREGINSTLKRIRGNGTYDELYTEWIGVSPTP